MCFDNLFQQSVLDEAEELVKKHLKTDVSGHDYFHVKRVVDLAEEIALKEHCDLFIVKLAAWLHDLDDPKLNEENQHYAERFLHQKGLSKESIDHILEIISKMSYTKQMAGHNLTSLEGKVVQDADRLDAIGAIGIARCFAYGGSKKRPIYLGDRDDESSLAHFYQKLIRLPLYLNTLTAKELAKPRMKLMEDFLTEFHNEWGE